MRRHWRQCAETLACACACACARRTPSLRRCLPGRKPQLARIPARTSVCPAARVWVMAAFLRATGRHEGMLTPGSVQVPGRGGGKLGFSPPGPERASPKASGAVVLGTAYPVVDRICWASCRRSPSEAGRLVCPSPLFLCSFLASPPPRLCSPCRRACAARFACKCGLYASGGCGWTGSRVEGNEVT